MRSKAFFLVFAACALSRGDEIAVRKDIEFAQVDGHHLKLDLYTPASKQTGPLVVWVHGGAWRTGTKAEMPLKRLVQDGGAIASVEYRLSTEARFPAQIHDIKAAIRFLRGAGAELKINTGQIVIAGASAGGHLAALVGVTNGHRELEGDVGDFDDQSSDVQGIISFFGAANLTTILSQSTPHGLSVRAPALELLLGASPEKNIELARLASPVFHVDKTDPPLLLFHGDQDQQMPINQAHELEGAYTANELKVRFQVIHGAGHGGAAFYDEKRLAAIKVFLLENFSPAKGKAIQRD